MKEDASAVDWNMLKKAYMNECEHEFEMQTHPWEIFLNARKNAIHWMKDDKNYSDKDIALFLSMDETQVYLIRTKKGVY